MNDRELRHRDGCGLVRGGVDNLKCHRANCIVGGSVQVMYKYQVGGPRKMTRGYLNRSADEHCDCLTAWRLSASFEYTPKGCIFKGTSLNLWVHSKVQA